MEDYKKKLAKAEAMRKANVATHNEAQKLLKEETRLLGRYLDSAKGGEKLLADAVREDRMNWEKWQAALVELVYYQEEYERAVKAKDKAGAADIAKKLKKDAANEKKIGKWTAEGCFGATKGFRDDHRRNVKTLNSLTLMRM